MNPALITCDLWEAVTGEHVSLFDMQRIVDNPVLSKEQVKAEEILELSRDRNGSRQLQKVIEEGTEKERSEIFNSIIPYIIELSLDPCANFVIQKLFDFATEKQIQTLYLSIIDHVPEIIDVSSGCRIVQRLVESTKIYQYSQLFQAIFPFFVPLCISQNGNHVIHSLVTSYKRFGIEIIQILSSNFMIIVVDGNGCRIIQKVFEEYSPDELRPLIDVVIQNSVFLATNQFGNYIVQNIVRIGKLNDINRVLTLFKDHLFEFSIHKFASNVIEKFIRGVDHDEKMRIFDEVIGTGGNYNYDRIISLSGDQYGNYVIQRVLDFGNESQQKAIYVAVSSAYDSLFARGFSKHVLMKLQNMGFRF